MAIEVTREKESATITSLDVPFWVHDPELDPGQELDRDDAVAAAAAASLSYVGAAAEDFSFERLGHHTARVTIQYREHQLVPLTPIGQGDFDGTVEFGFSGIQFQPEHRYRSLATIKYFEDGVLVEDSEAIESWQTHFRGEVNLVANKLWPREVRGYQLSLPGETDYANYVIPLSSLNASFRTVVASLLFKVSSDEFFGHPPGSVMLVRAQARRQTDATAFLGFGFSLKPNGTRNVMGRDGPVALSEVDGHDYVWSYDETFSNPGAGIEQLSPEVHIVERIWERADLNLLALPGSS